jgi:small basic protein
MISTKFNKLVIFSALTFILLGLSVSPSIAQVDSADIAIIYTTAYPSTAGGRIAWVEIWLDNHDFYVSGFQFMITLSNPDLIDFHTDSIGIDFQVIPVDTCTTPEPHGEECFVDSIKPVPVRYCGISTVGSLTSNFSLVECHGEVADTSQDNCNWISILGMAQYNYPIQPYAGGYRLLCRFGVDVLCLSDTVTDRSTSFYIAPGGNSFLSDKNGMLIPFRYHQGELMAWWSRPGDANADSLLDLGDALFILNYLFREGPIPCIPESADANADCWVDLSDPLTLLYFLFRGGPAPKPGCWHGY